MKRSAGAKRKACVQHRVTTQGYNTGETNAKRKRRNIGRRKRKKEEEKSLQKGRDVKTRSKRGNPGNLITERR